ncbi:MAG: HIT family protein [Microthrixaceae bacterium]
MEGCVFCEISRGERDPDVVAYQDEHVMVVPSLHQRPTNRGHMLVLTRDHFRNLYDVPPDLDARIWACVRRVADAIQDAFFASGTTIRQNNDPPGQDVFHFHVHVIPRYTDDDGLSGQSEVMALDDRLDQARRVSTLLHVSQ